MAILFVRLEKEYTTIKNKEMEEQVEIKVSDKINPTDYNEHRIVWRNKK